MAKQSKTDQIVDQIRGGARLIIAVSPMGKAAYYIEQDGVRSPLSSIVGCRMPLHMMRKDEAASRFNYQVWVAR